MKLGLIALSGLRAADPELTRLGFTLPGFVDRNRIIASLPSLGLLTLAGLTPPQFELEYIELPDELGGTLPGPFDAVAISSFSARIRDAYALADRYRANGTLVILGGLHVTALPREAALHADSIVLGEGEPLWSVLLSDLQARRLQRVYDARQISFDLADAPLPRYELLDFARYNRLTVQTQRGCPFDCEFCASSIRLSPTYKLKPIDKVIAEIHAIKEFWTKPFIEFADDNTFVNKPHSRALARALAREDVRWFTETDISLADDDELLGLLRDSGCAQVLIGLESAGLDGLDGLERKANWKAKQVDRYMEAIQRIQDHGITVNGCFVLGLDGTGTDSFDAVWRFVKESGLYEVQITVLTPFPGTPLHRRLAAGGRLLKEDGWERCTLFDVNFQPSDMTVRELELGLRELGTRLYSAEAVRERKANFRHRLRTVARRKKFTNKE